MAAEPTLSFVLAHAQKSGQKVVYTLLGSVSLLVVRTLSLRYPPELHSAYQTGLKSTIRPLHILCSHLLYIFIY